MFHRPPPHGTVQFCIMCKSGRVKCFTVSYDCNKYHHTSRWFMSIFPFLFISKIKLQIDFFISVWTVERFTSAWRSLKTHIWNHLNRTCTAFRTQSFNNYSAALGCPQPLFKFFILQTQYAPLRWVCTFNYIPIVNGVGHLFDHFLFLLQLMGHTLHVLFVVYIGILDELVAVPR